MRLGWAAIVWVIMAQGCERSAPPPYIRVQADAPRLEEVPRASAHLVVFWAAWCPPCVTEAPSLRDLARRPPDGVAVVTYSHDRSLVDAERHLGSPADTGLHLRLDEGHVQAERFGVGALPASFLVVGDQVVARFNGPRDWNSAAMRRLLERLVREASEPDLRGR